ncbi:MAG: amino terminal protease self-immunity [Firmicutes bacterium]|nr:amino terminal protease self-immunity [Bacillota bacterium]
MRLGPVSWGMKELLAVHSLRLVLGLILVRFVYPSLFTANNTVIELTDRLVVVLLVYLAVHQHHGFSWQNWKWRDLGRNIGYGLSAGVVLLGVSVFSERLYSTTLALTPVQHPLIMQVEAAASLEQLAVPLFLAGVAAPVAEEMLYRMFTFPVLKQRFGVFLGAIGSAAIFALFHFNAYWLAELLIVGTGLALLYYWSGSIISSIVAHSVINTTKILLVFFGLTTI